MIVLLNSWLVYVLISKGAVAVMAMLYYRMSNRGIISYHVTTKMVESEKLYELLNKNHYLKTAVNRVSHFKSFYWKRCIWKCCLPQRRPTYNFNVRRLFTVIRSRPLIVHMIIMPYAAQLHITLVRMLYQCINIFMEECCLYACDLCFMISHDNYPQASNINRTLVGNNNVDHSDVVGASPVGKKDTHLTYHSAWHLTFRSSLRQYSCLNTVLYPYYPEEGHSTHIHWFPYESCMIYASNGVWSP